MLTGWSLRGSSCLSLLEQSGALLHRSLQILLGRCRHLGDQLQDFFVCFAGLARMFEDACLPKFALVERPIGHNGLQLLAIYSTTYTIYSTTYTTGIWARS